jgi:hypothetical protein
MARAHNGTLCSLPAFMRCAGTVHCCLPKSISSHTALLVSPVRAAVRMVNSSALALSELRSRSSAMKAGNSL